MDQNRLEKRENRRGKSYYPYNISIDSQAEILVVVSFTSHSKIDVFTVDTSLMLLFEENLAYLSTFYAMINLSWNWTISITGIVLAKLKFDLGFEGIAPTTH